MPFLKKSGNQVCLETNFDNVSNKVWLCFWVKLNDTLILKLKIKKKCSGWCTVPILQELPGSILGSQAPHQQLVQKQEISHHARNTKEESDKRNRINRPLLLLSAHVATASLALWSPLLLLSVY